MPVMSGTEMLEELRKDEWGKTVKVIMLTNLSDPDRAIDSMDKGVVEYMVKTDWKLEEVLEKIRETLK